MTFWCCTKHTVNHVLIDSIIICSNSFRQQKKEEWELQTVFTENSFRKCSDQTQSFNLLLKIIYKCWLLENG